MEKRTLLIANPYDTEELSAIALYESSNDLEGIISNRLKETVALYSKDEYIKRLKGSNELEQVLLLEENGKIQASCLIKFYKDIRSCYINIIPCKKETATKELLNKATEYVFGIGMYEVFTTINSYDKALCELLQLDGYENLGEEDGMISFVKSFEKEGILNGNNKKY